MSVRQSAGHPRGVHTPPPGVPPRAVTVPEALRRTGLAGTGDELVAVLARDLPAALVRAPGRVLVDLAALTGPVCALALVPATVVGRGQV